MNTLDEGDDARRRVGFEADESDRQADASDWSAAKHDMAANLTAWLYDDDELGAAHDQRQAAARDRTAAKADRDAAADRRREE